jgi:hypothetical protein
VQKKIRGEIYLTIPLALYMFFQHQEPSFFVSLVLLAVVYGGRLFPFTQNATSYAARQLPAILRRGAEGVRREIGNWNWKACSATR